MRIVRPLLALIVLLTPLTAFATEMQSIKAVVNGEVITSYDYEQRWATIYKRIKGQYGDQLNHPEMQAQLAQLKEKLFDQMVDELILTQEATRNQIVISDQEIDGVINDIKQKQGQSAEAFQEFLAKNETTEEELRQSIREDMLKRRMVQSNVSSRIVITDKEIMDEYNRRAGASSGASAGDMVRTIHLSVIMASDEASMKKIVEEIDDGMTFAEAANTYSVGPAVGAGGDLGSFSFSDLSIVWREALDGVEKGEMSKPFEADGQYVLLLITDEAEGQAVAAIDEATHEAIYEELRQKKYDKLFEEFIGVMRERAVIEYK